MTLDLGSKLRRELRGKVLADEPLALHTSLRTGGPADYFITPDDLADLQVLLELLAASGTPYLVIGGGYNVLVRDGGFRGVVISLKRLDRLECRNEGCILAEAGATNQRLVRYTEVECFTGLEFLCAIPGTIGGAIAVNAGAHGEAVLEKLASITTLQNGAVTVRSRGELDFGYRYLKLHPGEIVISAEFYLKKEARNVIEGRIEALLSHRQAAQSIHYPSAGSFFKNPQGHQAWRLIDQAGLKGCRIGGAQVSEAHANFLVNRSGATAGDFMRLAELIKTKVKEVTGIDLEEEVRIVGED